MRVWIIGVLVTLAVGALVVYGWRGRAGTDPPMRSRAVELSPPQSVASPRPPAVPLPQSPPSSAQPQGDFAEVAVAELAQLRTGLTLREFAQSHPGEQPRPTSRINDPDLRYRSSCALGVASIPLNSGATLGRLAALYGPPIP